MFAFASPETTAVCGSFEIFTLLLAFSVLLKTPLYRSLLLVFLWIAANWALYRRALKSAPVKCSDMSEIAARLVSCAKRRDLDKACRISSLSDWKTAISKCLELFYVLVKSETDGYTKWTPQKVFWLTSSFYPLLHSGNSSLASYHPPLQNFSDPWVSMDISWSYLININC